MWHNQDRVGQEDKNEAGAARGGHGGGHTVSRMERAHHRRLARALGGHARVVRGRMQGQRQVGLHYVGAERCRDTARDRHQQSAASPQTASGHPGDGQLDVGVGGRAQDLVGHVSRVRRNEPRVDGQHVAPAPRLVPVP